MNTTPTDLKDLPEVHRIELPEHPAEKPPAGKNKKRGIIWAVFLLIIAGVTGYAVWRAGQPGAIPQQAQGFGNPRGGGRKGRGGGGLGPVPVVTAKVKQADVPVYFNGLGNVVAYYTVSVTSRVTGQLMKVFFNEGDLVKEGQTLIQIDPRPYQVALAQAEGQLAHDQALLEDARLDLERYKKLLEQDAIPSQQLDTQKYLVDQYVGTIKQDQANVDNAKLNLVYCNITAPFTGVVGLRLVDPGNIVQANSNQGMILLTQLQPIQVQFTIPEDSLPQVLKKLRAGDHLQAEAWNRDNSVKLATGQFMTVDNQIDSTTGRARLKAVFDNKEGTLFPQQFVNIQLKVDTLHNVLVVPGVAVQNGQQGTFVYVVDPQTSRVHLKTVAVGQTNHDVFQLTSGVAEGEDVVTDGADRLDDGTQVRVRAPGELEQINAPTRKGRGGRGNGNFKKGDFKGGDPSGAGFGGGSGGGFKKGDFKNGDFKGDFKKSGFRKGDGGGSNQ